MRFPASNTRAKRNVAARDGAHMSADANVATRTSASEGASPAQGQTTPVITPKVAARLGVLHSRLRLDTGQVVLAMLNLARSRHHVIADLQHRDNTETNAQSPFPRSAGRRAFGAEITVMLRNPRAASAQFIR